MTKRQKIDAARECRLWVSQIIIPAATVIVTAMTIPEVRQSVSNKYEEVRYKLKSRLKNKN